ncbi:MAG: hypothetical protein ABIF40_02840 [archaeon]
MKKKTFYLFISVSIREKSNPIEKAFFLRLRAGDKKILEQIQLTLKEKGYGPLLRLDKEKGTPSNFGRYNQDHYELIFK